MGTPHDEAAHPTLRLAERTIPSATTTGQFVGEYQCFWVV
jgi:hypothetical protein